MYKLPHFSEDDAEKLLSFVDDHPFATLVAVAPDQSPTATHIPVFAEKRGGKLFLKGHMLKTSDHCKAFHASPKALCIFNSSYAYVSATWYTDPHNASTVNYMAVHAKGQLRFLDEKALEDILQLTSLHFEKLNRDSPTIYSNLPEKDRVAMLKLIVAFEIEVSEFSGTFKLSQNRDKSSYDSIVSKLENGDPGQKEIAVHMKNNRSHVFEGK